MQDPKILCNSSDDLESSSSETYTFENGLQNYPLQSLEHTDPLTANKIPLSSRSEPDIIQIKLHPINPLLPPGYKNPMFVNGFPASTINFPNLDLLSPASNPIPSSTGTPVNKDYFEPNSNLNNHSKNNSDEKIEKLDNLEQQEENKFLSIDQTRPNSIQLKQSKCMLEFFGHFEAFKYTHKFQDIFCCSRPDCLKRLRKLKESDTNNENFKNKLIENFAVNIGESIKVKLKNCSIVDLYMACSILEDELEIMNYDNFLDTVKKSTDKAITIVSQMKLNSKDVLERFFGKTRFFLIDLAKRNKFENTCQLSLQELDNELNI